LSEAVDAKVALGRDNLAIVSWNTAVTGEKHIELRLEKAVKVTSQLPGGKEEEHGVIDHLVLKYLPS
jgi:hypothetical protein